MKRPIHPCAHCGTLLPANQQLCAFCGASLIMTPMGYALACAPAIESRGEIERRERALREVCCG